MLQSPRPQHVLEHGPPLESGTTDSERLTFRLRLRLSETLQPSTYQTAEFNMYHFQYHTLLRVVLAVHVEFQPFFVKTDKMKRVE